MLSELFDFKAGDIGANLVAALIALLLAPLGRWAFRGALTLNRKWNLWWVERELATVQRLHVEPGAVTEYFSGKTLLALMLIGAGMMFLPLAVDAAGRKIFLFVLWVIGICIYAITLNGLATVHHLRKSPEITIARLNEKIAKLKRD